MDLPQIECNCSCSSPNACMISPILARVTEATMLLRSSIESTVFLVRYAWQWPTQLSLVGCWYVKYKLVGVVMVKG
jgi:hypothetical protein